jgi:hypothetical protein
VVRNSAAVRSFETSTAAFRYEAAEQQADGVVAPFTITVAEVPGSVGAGDEARITIDG